MSKSRNRGRRRGKKKIPTRQLLDGIPLTPSSNCPVERSPAQRVHDSDYFRRETARYLSKSELAKHCAQVSKLWLDTVAERNYTEVGESVFDKLAETSSKAVEYTHRPSDFYLRHVRTIKSEHCPCSLSDYALRIWIEHPSIRKITGHRCRVELASKTHYVESRARLAMDETPTLQHHSTENWPSSFTVVCEEKLALIDGLPDDPNFLLSTYPSARCDKEECHLQRTHIGRVVHLSVPMTHSSLTIPWRNAISASPHLRRLQLHSNKVKSAEEILKMLDIRPQNLADFHVSTPFTTQLANIEDAPMISDVPDMLRALETTAEQAELEVGVRSDAASSLKFATLTLEGGDARDRIELHTGNQQSRGGRLTMLTLRVRIVLTTVSEDDFATSMWSMLLGFSPACQMSHVELRTAFASHWHAHVFDELFRSLVSKSQNRDELEHALKDAVQYVTADGWWYPGDVHGWA